MKQSIRLLAATALLASGAVVATGIGPAYAEDPAPSATAAVDAVGGIPGVEQQTATAAESPANIPTDPSQPVTFDGSPVKIAVETDGTTKTAQADGMTVYQGTDEAASTVVQPTGDGVRFMTVIKDATAPTDYAYKLDLPAGGSAVQNPDGSVAVLNDAGEGVASIQTPWAKDANGVALPTSYSVNGTQLTQHVDLAGSPAFPVVADPSVTSNCGWITCSYYLSRKLTRQIANKLARYNGASIGVIAAVAGAACYAAGPAAYACSAAGMIYGGFMVDQFLEAKRRNQCIRYRVFRLGALGGIYVDGSGYCRNR